VRSWRRSARLMPQRQAGHGTSIVAEHEQRFSSKVDWWYFLLIAVVGALSGIVAVPGVLAGRWWTVAALVAPLGLMIWNLLSTYYVVSGDTLSVRCLLVRKTVPLASVTTLRASRDFRSSPALSLHRIEVLYDNDSVLVSPKEKTAFIRALRARKPSIAIEELSEIA